MDGERYCKRKEFTGKEHENTAALISRFKVHSEDQKVVQVYLTL